MIEDLKKMYQLLLTEPYAPAVCDKLESMLRKAIAELESQQPLGYITIGREVLERALKALWLTANPESEKAILDIQQALAPAAAPPHSAFEIFAEKNT